MSDRKYGQRGYMDSDRESSGGGKKKGGAPPPRREGPRGRGLGAPTENVFRCGACHAKVIPPGAEEVAAVCPRCQAGLHACINCTHFDSGARFECRQPIPERVARKRDPNTCELFSAKTTVEFAQPATRDPDDARAEFDALFKF